MRRTLRAGTWLTAWAVAFVATTSLSAHDFWIEPSTFEARVGERVGIHLLVGEHFAGERVGRNESRIERFVLAGPDGEVAVPGRNGADPAGLVRLDAPGIWFVGYRSFPYALELPAATFERYLREEGLERILDERARRDESRGPGRERFSRSVKSLVRTPGSASTDGYDRSLGLPLEFVLDADPAAAPGGRVPVRLLRNGSPLEGALVVVFRKQPGAAAGAGEAVRGRTDAEGRFAFAVERGVWLVKAVHMDRAAAGSGADWESIWTSLTFRVP